MSTTASSFWYEIINSQSSPAISTTYFLLNASIITGTTVSGFAGTRFYPPYNGTFTTCLGSITCTPGSNEPVTIAIRKNNTTNTNVTTTLDLSVADATFSNTSLNLSVVVGDYIEMILITPNWVTPPTTCRLTLTLWAHT